MSGRPIRPTTPATTTSAAAAPKRRVNASPCTTAFMKLYCGMVVQISATDNAASARPSDRRAMP